MNTIRLFDQDSYMRDFEAQVVSCEKTEKGYMVVLDRTAFFPEGGGQSADLGLIRDMHVVDVQEKDGVVYHEISPADESHIRELAPGQIVRGHLDWYKRFDNMQQHSGEHIVSGIVHGRYGYNNVGFHLGDDVVTLDFDGKLTDEELHDIEEEANYAVFSNKPIVVTYPSKEELANLEYRSKIEIDGQVRLVSIEDYDVCACCAPHVAMTGEIGTIKFISCQNYKGGVRLSILCGFRALNDYRMKQDNITRIGNLLSVKSHEAADAVDKLHQNLQAAKYELMEAKEKLLLTDLDQLEQNQNHVCYFADELPAPLMKKAVNTLIQKYEGFCGVFSGNDKDGYQYLIASKSQDARVAGELLKEHFSCRGGGKADMIQGKIQGTKEAIEEVFTKL